MLFNSFEFAVFFVLTLAIYWGAAERWSIRKAIVIVASYIFYGAWNPPYLVLLLWTTALDYWIARGIGASSSRAAKRWLLALSCTTNLQRYLHGRHSPVHREVDVQYARGRSSDQPIGRVPR